MVDELQASSRQSAKHPPALRHARLRRRNAWALPLKAVVTTITVIALSALSISAYAAWDLAQTSKGGVALGNEDAIAGLSIAELKGGVNLLLVGVDKRPADGAFGDPEEDSGVLNDVTMLLHIAEDHQSATVVSFPRDLYVPIPGCDDGDGGTINASSQKINTTYFYGGLACTVKTVEHITGLTIPFAAEIEFYGVVALSNAVGGVTVCVADKIEDQYTGTFLDPGEHTLKGMAALQFLRTRHGVGDGSDLTRISNQQVFLSALVRKLTADGTLDNLTTLYSLAKAALANMQLSNSLHDPARMVSIAMALKGIPLENITFVQYPNRYVEGGGGVEIETTGADALNEALLNDQRIVLSGGSGGGALVESTTGPATAAPTETSSATPDPSASATAEPAQTGVATLPNTVTGTTAGTVTCSKGRTLDNQ
ncbi:MAG TPA: LCP family protein [Microbacteriaceae bacterium]|nr:LCP family protein [Microbacteriaceae bacterium]